MKQYARYKSSGIEWIGEIPDHWEVRKLKYVGQVQLSGVDKKNEPEEIKVLLCNYIDVYKNEFIDDSLSFMEASATKNEIERFALNRGDVLITKDSETPDDIANPAFVRVEKVEIICGYHLAHIRTNRDIMIGEFLFRLFQSPDFNAKFTVNAHGITRYGLSIDDIKSTKVLLPTVNEQTGISNYLDRKTAQIDELIAKKQKLSDLLNEEKTAIINQAVTKGLNPNAPMKDSGIPWLGERPAHWEIKKIKYIANLTLGKMLTGEDKGGNFLKPYLRAQNISWFKCDTSDVKEMWFSQSELIKYRVNLNDLLVSEGGDVGRTCIWMNELDECYIQNSVHKITFKKYFNPKYFLYLFYCFGRKGYFLSIVNQISIGHLTGEKLKEVFTIFPGFDEQTAIVDYLDRKTDQMDDVISKTHHEIELLREYRTALISEAVTGKIDVRI